MNKKKQSFDYFKEWINMYTYDDYDYDVIDESALDMAMDMSDRYGVAIEDAYDFACDALEGSLKDPRKRQLREENREKIARRAWDSQVGGYRKSSDKTADYITDKWDNAKSDSERNRLENIERKHLTMRAKNTGYATGGGSYADAKCRADNVRNSSFRDPRRR